MACLADNGSNWHNQEYHWHVSWILRTLIHVSSILVSHKLVGIFNKMFGCSFKSSPHVLTPLKWEPSDRWHATICFYPNTCIFLRWRVRFFLSKQPKVSLSFVDIILRDLHVSAGVFRICLVLCHVYLIWLLIGWDATCLLIGPVIICVIWNNNSMLLFSYQTYKLTHSHYAKIKIATAIFKEQLLIGIKDMPFTRHSYEWCLSIVFLK